MEFLIISDSHGRDENISRALAIMKKKPDGVIFLGDGLRDLSRAVPDNIPVYAVSGNCDYFTAGEPVERFVTLGNVNIFMTHGHKYGVKSGIDAAAAKALSLGADILLFGHTHVPTDEYLPEGSELCGGVTSRPLHLFNPGSIGYSTGEGFHFGTLTAANGKFLLAHGVIK